MADRRPPQVVSRSPGTSRMRSQPRDRVSRTGSPSRGHMAARQDPPGRSPQGSARPLLLAQAAHSRPGPVSIWPYITAPSNEESAMPTYLITNRVPDGFTPSSEAFAAWTAWFDSLGDAVADRGNPAFASTTASVLPRFSLGRLRRQGAGRTARCPQQRGSRTRAASQCWPEESPCRCLHPAPYVNNRTKRFPAEPRQDYGIDEPLARRTGKPGNRRVSRRNDEPE